MISKGLNYRKKVKLHYKEATNTPIHFLLLLLLITFLTIIFSNKVEAYSAKTANQSRWYTLNELNINQFDIFKNLGSSNVFDLPSKDIFKVIKKEKILTITESWENGVKNRKSIGYPSVVQNTKGENTDNLYYLYYSIHDPYSGIACAKSNYLDHDFIKIKHNDLNRADSQVLRAPEYPKKTSHFASPQVIWNPDKKHWHMYFHFYSNEWNERGGHQHTGMAYSKDLGSGVWRPLTDSSDSLISVIPITSKKWMNSQSSYHSIRRLSNGYWVAFMRGTGGNYDKKNNWIQNKTKVGLAVSRDGVRWAQIDHNPLFASPTSEINFSPLLIEANSNGEIRLFWSEIRKSNNTITIYYSTTDDFINFSSKTRVFENLSFGDGPISVYKKNKLIYIFTGAYRYTITK